jgi:hypothetical protein
MPAMPDHAMPYRYATCQTLPRLRCRTNPGRA